MDVLEGGKGQKEDDTGNQVHPENPEEAPRDNGMTPNQAETNALERS